MTESETPEQAKRSTSPGAVLARARKAQQLSLQEAARDLKLPRTTLEHIEADRFDQIALIYRRGYITNYARLLGLDPEPLLEGTGSLEPEPLRPVLPVAAKSQRFDRFLKFATYALVTTMIVPPLVYFFVLGGARLFEADLASRADTNNEATTAQAHKPGYRERFADALAVQPPETTRRDDSHLSASALPMTPIRAISAADTGLQAPDSDGAGTAGEVPDPASDLELILNDDSWVEIESADGQRLEFDLLRAGEARQYSGLAPFRLLLGRGSAVEMRLNGEKIAFEGHQQAGVTELVVGQAASPEASETSRAAGQPAD